MVDRAPLWVKVCGIRNPTHARVAEDAGADAIGLVLAPSPRRVSLAEAAAVAATSSITTVAVTVDLTAGSVPAIAATGITMLQPHGAHAVEAAEAARQLGLDVLFPVRVTRRLRPGAHGHGYRTLLDAPATANAPAAHGGTGRTFDWSLIEPDGSEFVLAGGLGPDNVAAAVTAVRPWGVDASSGLESAPGEKDVGKIHAYVENARNA